MQAVRYNLTTPKSIATLYNGLVLALGEQYNQNLLVTHVGRGAANVTAARLMWSLVSHNNVREGTGRDQYSIGEGEAGYLLFLFISSNEQYKRDETDTSIICTEQGPR